MTKRFITETGDIKAYQDAVWSYLMEHCDVMPKGGIFVKFHTSGRVDFEKHIKARWLHGYHRKDKRTGETPEEKEKRAERLRMRREVEREVREEIRRKHRARQVHKWLARLRGVVVLWRRNPSN